jgi:homoserine dehydrogenase
MKDIKVGLLGFGTIGTGVVKILLREQKLLKNKLGANIVLKKIADIDIKRDRGIKIPAGMLTKKAEEMLEDPEISIIIELIGGTKVAREYILRALRNGKHVVTANKALLSEYCDEIFFEAIKRRLEVGFEASVAGGIPIIRSIKEGLIANKFECLYGIINGTSNYILTKMGEEGKSFKDVLANAQAKGYAEADPSLDVDGIDSVHKLIILILLCFGVIVKPQDIPAEGIRTIDPIDFDFARDFGYKIKLLAIARRLKDNEIEARVHPTLIPVSSMLASVDGVYNAVNIVGDKVGSQIFIGKGAGMMPTASAVVSDLIDVSRRLIHGGAGMASPFAFTKDAVKRAKIIEMGKLKSRYYLRFFVTDKPGVLAKIADILGKNNVSIESVIQKGRNIDGGVPIVIVTHTAFESDLKRALKSIDSLEVVLAKSSFIRIEDKIV